MGQSPRQFCQEQLLLLGDEELVPAVFEARLRVLASAGQADGSSVAAASSVAQVLLDAWQHARGESPP